MNQKKKSGRKVISYVLALVMVFSTFTGIVPGTSKTAYAAEQKVTFTAAGKKNGITVSPTLYTNGAFFVNNRGNVNKVYIYSSNYNITKLVLTDRKLYSGHWGASYLGASAGNVSFSGDTMTVTGINAKTVIIQGENQLYAAISSIDVYYDVPDGYSVTINPGSDMTKTDGSGAASQTGVTGAITDVVYTANDGYYFPTDYTVAEDNGIKVTRDSYTQITVSGTPTADAAITLTAPTEKTTPDAPTTVKAFDCTTADNNDGKLTGVTTDMEYKKSDATEWTAGTGSDITGLVPGTYYVRVKATDTTLASDNQELTIASYLTVAKEAAKGELATYRSGKADSDYDEEGVIALNTAKTNGDTAIEAATTTESVATALQNAKDAIDAVKTKAQKDQDAADAVIAKINALPATDAITSANKDAIEAARKAYDALTADQKKLVDTTTLKKLTDAEAALTAAEESEKAAAEKKATDEAAAKAVTDKINALPSSDKVSITDKEAIEAARKAYDALTADQKKLVDATTLKKLVDATTLKKLTDAEAALTAAEESEKAAAEKKATDEAAAKAVTDKINALPSNDKVATTDKDAIEAARKAYDALTADQKKLVDTTTLKKLTDAEAALTAAENKKDEALGNNYSSEWVDGLWYNADGTQTYGYKGSWKTNGFGWWYEAESGWYPVATWQKIDGKWYYFDAEGYMASNEWIGGYWLSGNGAWEYEYIGSWKTNGTDWWYEDTSGWYPVSQWQKIDGKWYYFGSDGIMLTDQYIGEYWVGSDGSWQ